MASCSPGSSTPGTGSPSSPRVAKTRTTRWPAAAARASVPPAAMASSSGCAWKETMVPTPRAYAGGRERPAGGAAPSRSRNHCRRSVHAGTASQPIAAGTPPSSSTAHQAGDPIGSAACPTATSAVPTNAAMPARRPTRAARGGTVPPRRHTRTSHVANPSPHPASSDAPVDQPAAPWPAATTAPPTAPWTPHRGPRRSRRPAPAPRGPAMRRSCPPRHRRAARAPTGPGSGRRTASTANASTSMFASATGTPPEARPRGRARGPGRKPGPEPLGTGRHALTPHTRALG